VEDVITPVVAVVEEPISGSRHIATRISGIRDAGTTILAHNCGLWINILTRRSDSWGSGNEESVTGVFKVASLMAVKISALWGGGSWRRHGGEEREVGWTEGGVEGGGERGGVIGRDAVMAA